MKRNAMNATDSGLRRTARTMLACGMLLELVSSSAVWAENTILGATSMQVYKLADGSALECESRCDVTSHIVDGKTIVIVKPQSGGFRVTQPKTDLTILLPDRNASLALTKGAQFEVTQNGAVSATLPPGGTFKVNGTSTSCSLDCVVLTHATSVQTNAEDLLGSGGTVDTVAGPGGANIVVKSFVDGRETTETTQSLSAWKSARTSTKVVTLGESAAQVNSIHLEPGQTANDPSNGKTYSCEKGCTLTSDGGLGKTGSVVVSDGDAKITTLTMRAALGANTPTELRGVKYTGTKACTINYDIDRNVSVSFSDGSKDGLVTVDNPGDGPPVKLTVAGATAPLIVDGGVKSTASLASTQFVLQTAKDEPVKNIVIVDKQPMTLTRGQVLQIPELGDMTVTCIADQCKFQYDPDLRTVRLDFVDASGNPGDVNAMVSGGTVSPPVAVIYGNRSDGTIAGAEKGKGDRVFFLDKGDKVAVLALEGDSMGRKLGVQVAEGDGAVRTDWADGLGGEKLLGLLDIREGIADLNATTPSCGTPGPIGPGMSVLTNEELDSNGNPAALGDLGKIRSWPAGAFSFEASFPITMAVPLLSHDVTGSGAFSSFVYDYFGSTFSGSAGGTPKVCSPSECPSPQIVRWGYWDSGVVNDGAVNNTVTSANRLHYLIGSATDPNVILNRTGSDNYSRIGGTPPVGADGTIYSVSAGTLLVNFGSTQDATLSNYSVAPVSGPSNVTYTFTSIPLGMSTVTGPGGSIRTLSTSSPASGTNSGRLQMGGLFLGPAGNHVGFAVNVTHATLGAVKIKSVEVFRE